MFHRTTGQLHKPTSFFGGVPDHVDEAVNTPLADPWPQAAQGPPVTGKPLDRVRQVGCGPATVQDGHLVAQGHQLVDYFLADQAGTTEHEYPHAVTIPSGPRPVR